FGGKQAVRSTRQRAPRVTTLRELCFEPIPETEAEGIAIAQLLKVQPWLGGQVVRSRLEKLRSPQVLHLALPSYTLAEAPREPGKAPARKPAERWENPLLGSGLALAGANGKAEAGGGMSRVEQGLFTARDVLGLDLHGADLVVLSASESDPGPGSNFG